MRVALLGRGRMGRLVEERARDAGHEIAVTIGARDAGSTIDELTDALSGVDVAVDFSVASAVLRHAEACARARTPLVVGTTGWSDVAAEVVDLFGRSGGAMVHGANFSLGANLFVRVVARAGELFATAAEFGPFVEEAHHAAKRDAPSGTALELSGVLEAALARAVPVASTRAGHIPGTHRVGFDSPWEQVVLSHEARSREGFAAGALVAARWIVGRAGVFAFADVIDSIIEERSTTR